MNTSQSVCAKTAPLDVLRGAEHHLHNSRLRPFGSPPGWLDKDADSRGVRVQREASVCLWDAAVNMISLVLVLRGKHLRIEVEKAGISATAGTITLPSWLSVSLTLLISLTSPYWFRAACLHPADHQQDGSLIWAGTCWRFLLVRGAFSWLWKTTTDGLYSNRCYKSMKLTF